MRIADNGAPVEVDGVGDLKAALMYSTHPYIVLYSENFWQIWMSRSDVHSLFGAIRSVFISGLRLSPLDVAVSPTNIRIVHDVAFIAYPSASSVNASTDFESAPKLRLGRVLRYIVWRVLLLRPSDARTTNLTAGCRSEYARSECDATRRREVTGSSRLSG